ncbi:Phorbol-ester/DAG-type domain-containing protein [Heracleum sosnowskyi]|uniref:Phorbol-ester/DAG-type domain-containing protein n=1 Tax=Heracleum sosnowskyi TaxID=360622 RepID=A0AAD8J490_9APIA|nr:Phorbol-ester/DAG-type domain-containing protein [Heracleum sosnowskyi]
MEDIKIYHPSHPEHELVLRNFKKPYHCDGCKQQGFGPRYRCESSNCDYVLHESCMFNSQSATHDFYSDCTFKFSYEPRSCGTWCDACGRNINGFVYHCADKELDFHPCCLNLKNKLVIDDGVKFKLNDKVTSKCIWCKRKSLKGKSEGGWSYTSKCNQYHFHVHCITELIQESWKRGDYENETTSILSLKDPELRLRRSSNGGSWSRGGKYWKIVKLFMTAVVSILLGDPTAVLATTLFNVIT